MSEYYSVTEYAQIKGKDPGNIRRLLIKGKLQGEKIGNQWVIPKNAEYPVDQRVKSGKYHNWRKIKQVREWNPKLMKEIQKMCGQLSDVYGDSLEMIIMYGSYARGDQTKESDLDIALVLKEKDDEASHDKMTEIVVDYELDQEVTLSVITIEREHYDQWKRVLPFYMNIAKEGIVIWRAA